MRLLIGTKNSGKIIEISEALSDLDIDIVSPSDLGIHDEPKETSGTFEGNALQKALFYNELSSLPTIADDSGIHVEALQNELGVETRRWGAGSDATDEEWIQHFLNRMKTESNKRAAFTCIIAYIDASGNERLFEGRCEGVVTPSLEADYLPGLPISACFKPDGCDKVFSALTLEEKGLVSHRGKATEAFKNHLITDA